MGDVGRRRRSSLGLRWRGAGRGAGFGAGVGAVLGLRVRRRRRRDGDLRRRLGRLRRLAVGDALLELGFDQRQLDLEDALGAIARSRRRAFRAGIGSGRRFSGAGGAGGPSRVASDSDLRIGAGSRSRSSHAPPSSSSISGKASGRECATRGCGGMLGRAQGRQRSDAAALPERARRPSRGYEEPTGELGNASVGTAWPGQRRKAPAGLPSRSPSARSPAARRPGR